jgi:hypothetical protein
MKTAESKDSPRAVPKNKQTTNRCNLQVEKFLYIPLDEVFMVEEIILQ